MEKVLVRRGQGDGILLMDPSLFKLHRYLFIFSHNRSYTTLLCHILGSHRQIKGYTETMFAYETAVDLYRLNAKAYALGNYRHDSEYVLDKLLYDFQTVSDKVLGLPRIIPIFLVREPEPTIASLARMRVREYEQGIHGWKEGSDRRGGCRYSCLRYTSRLEDLANYFRAWPEALGRRGIFLPAECLLEDTAASLPRTRAEPGRPARRGLQDLREDRRAWTLATSSMVIRTGRIVRDPSSRKRSGDLGRSPRVPRMLTRHAGDAASPISRRRPVRARANGRGRVSVQLASTVPPR